MFWARPRDLEALFALHLNWEDYPEEPLPQDGTMLHALERLFGLVAMSGRSSVLLTNVAGVTR
jgi:lipopolysaccharide biosynthesis protein